MKCSPLRRLLLSLLALCLLVQTSGATWSIVVVDRRTGEVCVASATCLIADDLTGAVPVIVVGLGAGATQSLVDSGENRIRIREGFLSGQSPTDILARITLEDLGLRGRQFGIVDLVPGHDPVTFTGQAAGRARKGIAGVAGDIAYAVQGNVLASQTVIDECVAVLVSSPGDLGQRVLAAMVRARQLGGDGRCSCSDGNPFGGANCGTPPPDFEKSAHCGFILLARMGDTDGTCLLGHGCANGDYYMRLNIALRDAQMNDPDPVDQLVERYAVWRADRAGRPDGILSRTTALHSLPADGRTEREVRIQLVDLEGDALSHGGATVTVETESGAPPQLELGPVADRGDGTYSFKLRSGTTVGTDRFVVRATDDLVRATLYPYLEVRSDPVNVLHAGLDRLSAAQPADVPFVVQEPSRPGAKFWLVGSLQGKVRGLGFDPSLSRFLLPAIMPFFPGPPGVLDRTGRAEALYPAPSGALLPLVGLRLEWTARIYGRGLPIDSNTVGVEIVR